MDGQAWQKVADEHSAALRRELNRLDELQSALCKASEVEWAIKKMVNAQRVVVRRMQRRDVALVRED